MHIQTQGIIVLDYLISYPAGQSHDSLLQIISDIPDFNMLFVLLF